MHRRTSLAFASGLLVCAAVLILSGASADAAMISTENTVVVLRVGEGSTATASTAARVYLEEYSIGFSGGVPVSATHVQTIPINHTSVDPNAFGTKLTVAGTASVEGGMNFSTNGQYLMFGGYHAEVGETTSGKRKIVARVDLAGNVSFDAIYGPGTTSSGNAMRTVTSLDGSQYWFGMSASPGIAYRTWENGNNSGVDATSLNTQNTRRLEIFNNQLYVGSAAGGVFGVATVGSGTPTTSGQTVTVLPGMPTTTGPSSYDFFFADANTLYVADDRTNTNGGLQKWVFDSGSGMWSLVYTKNIDTSNNTFDNGLRGLTGGLVGTDGTVTLFATTTFGTAGGANFLVGISDTLANTNPASVIVNSLASAASIPSAGGAFTNFRGIEAIGVLVPEPGSVGLLAVGGMFLLTTRRRKA